MSRILAALSEHCTGCRLCQTACAVRHGSRFAPDQACVGVDIFGLLTRAVPSVCFQCANPDCAAACPEGAIRHDESGVVQVDAGRCTGCGLCVAACPWGQMQLGTDGRAYKCDLCGGDPSCTQACRFGALVFAEPDRDLRARRGEQMMRRCEEGAPAVKRRQLARMHLGLDAGR